MKPTPGNCLQLTLVGTQQFGFVRGSPTGVTLFSSISGRSWLPVVYADLFSAASMGSSHKSTQPQDLQDSIMQSACAMLRNPRTTPDRLSTLLDTFTRLVAPAAAGASSADGGVDGLPAGAAAAPPSALASEALEQFRVMLAGARERADGEEDPEALSAVLQEVLQRGALALEDVQNVYQQVLHAGYPHPAETAESGLTACSCSGNMCPNGIGDHALLLLVSAARCQASFQANGFLHPRCRQRYNHPVNPVVSRCRRRFGHTPGRWHRTWVGDRVVHLSGVTALP